ncbi:MAG: electron transfer flavoprotein subunit beta/FixA family protein [Gracilibacteraceae bacterium]|jgi:electron transfer flavoprotein beta subunit|nr:electron transfer flavoprotein subunit beta/FixA family protein [Gracilibacteraceae bacterium]
MHIVVCIKQVPDTTEVRIDPVKNTLIRDGVPSIVNPFDECAVEAALRFREAQGGRVTVLSMGPPQAETALRKGLAMGADDAVLVSDRAVAGADTLATSYTLAQAIRKLGDVELIFCGKMAIDGDTAQVGPGIAEHLGWPQVTYVQKIKEVYPDHLVVERAAEGGAESVRVSLPALIAVEKSIGEPRYPSVKGSVRAEKAAVTVWSAADIEAPPDKTGLNGSPTQVMQIFTPEVKAASELLSGDTPEALADALIARLLAAELIVREGAAT